MTLTYKHDLVRVKMNYHTKYVRESYRPNTKT